MFNINENGIIENTIFLLLCLSSATSLLIAIGNPSCDSVILLSCISPKKCSCGATSGKALGHKWTEANCKAPKTCSVCKTIDGDKGKHL